MTRSIFQKVCPSCMITLSLDNKQCPCGHAFDTNNAGESTPSSEEIRLNAEELYENYLAARVEQAVKSAKVAQADFARDPGNPKKSKHITRAIDEAREARTNLAAQKQRVAELKNSLQAVIPHARLPVRMAAPRTRVTQSMRPRNTKTIQARRNTQTMRQTKAEHRITSTARRNTAPVKQTSTVPRITKTIRTRTTRNIPPSTTAPTTSHAKTVKPSAQPSTGKRSTVEIQAESRQKATIIEPISLPVTLTPVTSTPKAFRETQSIRAEKIMRTVQIERAEANIPRVQPSTPPKAEQPINTLRPSTTLGAHEKRECPNCTASVPGTAPRCRCGFEFANGDYLIPELSMTDEERAAFAKILTSP